MSQTVHIFLENKTKGWLLCQSLDPLLKSKPPLQPHPEVDPTVKWATVWGQRSWWCCCRLPQQSTLGVVTHRVRGLCTKSFFFLASQQYVENRAVGPYKLHCKLGHILKCLTRERESRGENVCNNTLMLLLFLLAFIHIYCYSPLLSRLTVLLLHAVWFWMSDCHFLQHVFEYPPRRCTYSAVLEQEMVTSKSPERMTQSVYIWTLGIQDSGTVTVFREFLRGDLLQATPPMTVHHLSQYIIYDCASPMIWCPAYYSTSPMTVHHLWWYTACYSTSPVTVHHLWWCTTYYSTSPMTVHHLWQYITPMNGTSPMTIHHL